MDIATKVVGDKFLATDCNQIVSELETAITDTGLSLTNTETNQLSKTISNYVAGGDFYTDSGAADAYILSVVGSKKAPSAYTNGMKIRFRAGNINTGASTVNVNSLGVKNIKLADGSTNPSAGDIGTDCDTEAVYDGTSFRLLNIKRTRLDVLGRVSIGGNLAVTGAIEGTFQRIYYNELSSTASTINITGLNGDTDIEYKLNIIYKAEGLAALYLRFNNDSGNNYAVRVVDASTTTVSTGETSGLSYVGLTAVVANTVFSPGFTHIFAKSGKVRCVIGTDIRDLVGSSVPSYINRCHTWSNTASVITSINLTSVGNDFSVGTMIELYARR